jgi:hypothetical protein
MNKISFTTVFLIATGGLVAYSAYRVLSLVNKVEKGAGTLGGNLRSVLPSALLPDEEEEHEYDLGRTKDLTPSLDQTP